MSKHTAGPWIFKDCPKVGEYRIYGDGNWQVGATHLRGETSEANARLIAAAPELLETLEDVLPILESFDLSHDEKGEELLAYSKIKAAIAKARG